MARPTSTEIVLVGRVSSRVFDELDSLPNLRAERFGAEAAAQDEDVAEKRARSFAASVHSPYAVHDVDPLASVGRAWVTYFDESAPAGTLEVAVEELIARLRRGSATLPDYFVVLDPESLPVTERHWWLGAVAGAAPSRVVPAPSDAWRLAQTIAGLPAGRWWPDDEASWLHGLASTVPDRIGRL